MTDQTILKHITSNPLPIRSLPLFSPIPFFLMYCVEIDEQWHRGVDLT